MLDQIIAHKRTELAEFAADVPLAKLQQLAAWQGKPRDFAAALRPAAATANRVPSLIAEVKRASPSRGTMNADLDPATLAHDYAKAGARAISVLTDRKFFRGDLRDLEAVRRAVNVPVLRKDFLLDEYGVWQSRVAGADAILLIVAALTDDELTAMLALSKRLGMAALVEVHDEAELERALRLPASIIGINNRNLRTFEVDPTTTLRLRAHIPADRIVVAESGIRSYADVAQLRFHDIDAMLVGEALVTSQDVSETIRELLYG